MYLYGRFAASKDCRQPFAVSKELVDSSLTRLVDHFAHARRDCNCPVKAGGIN